MVVTLEQRFAMQMIPAFVEGRLEPVEKLDVHRRGLRHPAVSVFVMRDGSILLQQRALTKYHTPGLWANTCCTHPHWGEAAATCAARRLDEELGLRDLPMRGAGVLEYRADLGGGLTEHEIVDIFVAEAPAGVEPLANPDEVAATTWVTLTDLHRQIAARPEQFTPWLRIYLAHHAQLIFGDSLAG